MRTGPSFRTDFAVLYRFRDCDAGEFRVSGAELLQRGLPLRLENPAQSALLFYTSEES